MKNKKKLHRVDINLKYLVYADVYEQDDVLAWMREAARSGELDDACEISLVNSSEEVSDFDEDYNVYYVDEEDEGVSLEEIIDNLGLDADKLIERLEGLGYKVTKPVLPKQQRKKQKKA